jgi:hypothetical protein
MPELYDSLSLIPKKPTSLIPKKPASESIGRQSTPPWVDSSRTAHDTNKQLPESLQIPGNTFYTSEERPIESATFAGLAGMDVRAEHIHMLLGDNTKDPGQIKIYITKDHDTLYIQSNFLAEDGSKPGSYSANPTKVRTNAVKNLVGAFENIIYWVDSAKHLPPGWENTVQKSIASAEIFIDPAALDADGRPPIDLSGATDIRLANDRQSLPAAGPIELLELSNPPPGLMERLSGCCFNGLPPGHAAEIRKQLSKQPVTEDNAVLLPLVADSGTLNIVKGSKILKRASERVKSNAGESWNAQIDKAMRAAKGRTLILLSHIVDGAAVVEDATGATLFSTPVEQLQTVADQNQVNLILFGCETAASLNKQSLQVGVIGKYNTATAAKRIETALESSKDANEFLSKVAAEDLIIVAKPRLDGLEVDGYAPPNEHTGLMARVMRILFLKSKT